MDVPFIKIDIYIVDNNNLYFIRTDIIGNDILHIYSMASYLNIIGTINNIKEITFLNDKLIGNDNSNGVYFINYNNGNTTLIGNVNNGVNITSYSNWPSTLS